MGGFTGPIAELYASLRLEAADFQRGLAVAKSSLNQLAESMGASFANQEARVREIADLMGGEYTVSIKKAQREISELTVELNKQALAQKIVREAMLSVGRAAAGETTEQRQHRALITEQIIKQTAATTTLTAAEIEKNKVSATNLILERERIAASDFLIAKQRSLTLEQKQAAEAAAILRSITVTDSKLLAEAAVRLAASQKLSQQEATAFIIASKKIERLQVLAEEQNKARDFAAARAKEVLSRQEQTAAELAALRLVRLHAQANDENRVLTARAAAAARTQATVAGMAAETAAAKVQSDILRGLYLSTWMMGGRAGFIAGLAGMAGATTVAAAGTVLGLAASTKIAADFNSELIRMTANMRDASDVGRSELAEMVTDLSNRFPIAAIEILKSMDTAREAGLSLIEATRALPIFLEAAVVNRTSSISMNEALTTSIKNITEATVAWGLRTGDMNKDLENLQFMTDLTAKAARLGGQSSNQFADGMAAAGAKSREMGFDARETAAALAALSLRGFDASRAGEILAQVMGRLQDEERQNTENWKALGIALRDQTGHVRPLADILADIGGLLNSADKNAVAAAQSLLGLETRTAKMLAPLAQSADEIRRMGDSLLTVNDHAKIVANEGINNLNDKLSILFNRASNAARELASPLVGALDVIVDSLLRVSLQTEEADKKYKAYLDSIGKTPSTVSLTEREAFEKDSAAISPAGLKLPGVPGISTEDLQRLSGVSTIGSTDTHIADLKFIQEMQAQFNNKQKADLDDLMGKIARVNQLRIAGVIDTHDAEVLLIAMRERAHSLEVAMARERRSVEDQLNAQLSSIQAENEAFQGNTSALKFARIDAERDKALAAARETFGGSVALAQKLADLEVAIVANAEAKKQEIREKSAATMASLNQRLAAFTKDLADKDLAASTKASEDMEELDKRAMQKARGTRAVDRSIKDIVAQDRRMLDLQAETDSLRQQSLDGQANRYTFQLARMDAQTRAYYADLQDHYGDDLRNFQNIEEAKALFAEIMGQRKRQVIERYASELQRMFEQDIRSAESFKDAMANIFDDMAAYFERVIFKMVIMWATGQSEMINASQQSGGLGGLKGVLLGLAGGLLGGLAPGAGIVGGVNTDALIGAGDMLLQPRMLPGFATGGEFRAGDTFIAGEQGPELITASAPGRVIPSSEMGGGTTIINNIDARGADVGVVQRLTRALEVVQRKSVENAVITTREMALRGA